MKFVPSVAAFAAASVLACPSICVAAANERGRDALVVTATRVEQPISEVIGAVSVITRDDIDRRGAHSLQDLLRGETGLSVVNTGGLGKLSNVFLRGADSEQLLVLVDGVRVGSATSGTTAFELLPVDQIERIEIIRGPRSSIYGSDAIGGVIQIFTRKGGSPTVSVGAGSHETSKVSGSFGTESDSAWVNLSASRIETEGYNSCAGAPFPIGGGCFTSEPDRDGYDNSSGSLRAGYRWQSVQIEGSALYATGTTEYDGDFANVTEFVEQVLSFGARIEPTEYWTLSLLLGSSRDEHDSFFDDPLSDEREIFASRFDTERQHASLQSDFLLTRSQTVTLGIDYFDDRVDSTVAFEETSRNSVGAFAQYQIQLGAHRLLGSVRTDDNEQFGNYETGSLGWKWSLSEQWSINAAWGNAFGAPTFNDLYYPGFSNPELDPETSRSYELGVGWTIAPITVALTAFESRIEDLIVYNPATFSPANLNSSRIRGIEADLDASIGKWTLGLGYSALDPRNRTPGADFDNFLPRRSRHTGHIELGRAFGAFDTRVRLTTEGARFDDVSNTNRVGGYALIDLTFDYALSATWTIQGKIGNLLDRDYRTVRLYNQDDRTFFVNLRFRPE